MIRSEIIENSDGPVRLVEPCCNIITQARQRLLTQHVLDKLGIGKAFVRSSNGDRNYVISAFFPLRNEIGTKLTITGVQLSPYGVYQHDLISLTLPSNTSSATPQALIECGLESYSTQGLQRLAEELRTGSQITRTGYYALFPRVYRFRD